MCATRPYAPSPSFSQPPAELERPAHSGHWQLAVASERHIGSFASAASGSGATVTVVDADDDPNAESGLGVYRAHYDPNCITCPFRPIFNRARQADASLAAQPLGVCRV